MRCLYCGLVRPDNIGPCPYCGGKGQADEKERLQAKLDKLHAARELLLEPKDFNFHVAGVTYEGRQAVCAKCRVNDRVLLVREPTNRYDPNAVIVALMYYDDAVGHITPQIGYVPKTLAREIAPILEKSYRDKLAVGFITHVVGGSPGYSYGIIVGVRLDK